MAAPTGTTAVGTRRSAAPGGLAGGTGAIVAARTSSSSSSATDAADAAIVATPWQPLAASQLSGAQLGRSGRRK